MDDVKKRAYTKLHDSLEELVTIYRHLLSALRVEKESLVEANSEKIFETSQNKDALLKKARAMDSLRAKYAEEMSGLLNGDIENPRLLEIAQKLGGDPGEKLRGVHATLELLIKRITDLNQANESMAKSALKALSHQMTEIKENLSGKTTYEKKGQVRIGPETSGHFVRKEA